MSNTCFNLNKHFILNKKKQKLFLNNLQHFKNTEFVTKILKRSSRIKMSCKILVQLILVPRNFQAQEYRVQNKHEVRCTT